MAKILIIDDEEQVRLYLRKILEPEGHEVEEASDGKVGIRLYREEPADLIIMDIFMPEKEGFETIRELRRDYPDVKIIAISGGGKRVDLEILPMAKRFGALRALAKPFTRQEMLDAVQEVLNL
ncbi:MAG: response regulator [Desulfobacterales bacterium]|nr:response regulator [Desulfobacterales bacterium]